MLQSPPMREFPPILTSTVAAELLAAAAAGESKATVSLDLGHSLVDVRVAGGAAWIGGATLGRAALENIAEQGNKCFEIIGGAVRAISVFSETTGWVRTLAPTVEAPTTLVAGFPMHRIRGTTPLADTRAKVRVLGRPRGQVLDTATGLGYTAMELAKTSAAVVTVEVDPAAIELARRNPWSAGLFIADNIRLIHADVGEAIHTFATGEFSAVLHDPPTLRLAGRLYSAAFYAELRRVLKPGGRLFHYVGDVQSGTGAVVARGVARRLTEVGFADVRQQKQAFGVTAVAGRGRRRG